MSAVTDNKRQKDVGIFGYFGFPEMGIAGAATATLIARGVGMVISLSFLHFHYKLLNFNYKSVGELLKSWSSILSIGIPNVLVRLLPQLTRTLMTKIAATMAVASVAAIAAGQRIESFSVIVSMAIGVSIVPIIGQNYGAKKFNRVMETRGFILKIAAVYGVMLVLISIPLGDRVASIFSNDPEVISLTATYIKIIFIGSMGLNQYNWISEIFNASGKPKYSVIINVLGTLFFIVPALSIGAYFWEFQGMLYGLCLGQILTGILAIVISKKRLV